MPSIVYENGVVRNTKRVPIETIMFNDYLEKVFKMRFSETALVDGETGDTLSFGELLKIVKSLAASIQRKGIRSRDMVVFTARNSLKSCCTLLALIFCQVQIIIPKFSYTAYEYGVLLKQFDLSIMIGDQVSAPKLEKAALNHTQPVQVLNLETDSFWKVDSPNEFTQPPSDDPKKAVLLMIFTSGSTGPSKAVCASHYNICASLVQWELEFSEFMLSSPLSHLSGFLSLTTSLAQGMRTVVVSESLKDDFVEFCNTASKFEVKTLIAMPVIFNKLVNQADIVAKYLDKVTQCFVGGSVVPQPVVDKFRSLYPHISVLNVFGCSESAGIVLMSHNGSAINFLEVVPNVEAKILDLKTREVVLKPGDLGELILKAPSNAIGYFDNPKATKETFVDGWLMTGDMAYIDDRGLIVIVDRVKQMIKCLDSQVAPADLEIILSGDKDVADVLVGGVSHSVYGEAPTAFVVPKKGASLPLLRKRLIEDIESKCAYFKRLHGGVFFIKKIPETDSGKFSRKEVVDLHLEKKLSYLDDFSCYL